MCCFTLTTFAVCLFFGCKMEISRKVLPFDPKYVIISTTLKGAYMNASIITKG